MLFHIFLPYVDSGAENSTIEDYYSDAQDYIKALKAEEAANGQMIFNTMAGGGIDNGNAYNGFGRRLDNVEEKIAYAKADCTLFSPNGATPEDVDSIIDKFAAQKEFLLTVNLNESSIEPEFEEELRTWWDENKNIKSYSQKMAQEALKKGSSRAEVKKMCEEWVNTNIPRRELRLNFKNKSDKTISFSMEKCEIEEKISRNCYLIYVNKLHILK